MKKLFCFITYILFIINIWFGSIYAVDVTIWDEYSWNNSVSRMALDAAIDAWKISTNWSIFHDLSFGAGPTISTGSKISVNYNISDAVDISLVDMIDISNLSTGTLSTSSVDLQWSATLQDWSPKPQSRYSTSAPFSRYRNEWWWNSKSRNGILFEFDKFIWWFAWWFGDLETRTDWLGTAAEYRLFDWNDNYITWWIVWTTTIDQSLCWDPVDGKYIWCGNSTSRLLWFINNGSILAKKLLIIVWDDDILAWSNNWNTEHLSFLWWFITPLTDYCWDGIVQNPNFQNIQETCDDANVISWDWCGSSCQIENKCSELVIEKCIRSCTDLDKDKIECENYCYSSCQTFDLCSNQFADDVVVQECDKSDINCKNRYYCYYWCDKACQVLWCGNWVIDSWETCDDLNNISWDWCSSSCQVEWRCTEMSINHCVRSCTDSGKDKSVCQNYCNSDCQNFDLCSNEFVNNLVLQKCDKSDILCRDKYYCDYWCDKSCQTLLCSNNIIDTWESCDDGNLTSWDWCSSICQLEIINCDPKKVQECRATQCKGLSEPSYTNCRDSCKLNCNSPICNINKADVCVSECKNKWLPEEICKICYENCTTVPTPICGNKILDAWEICDDGNTVSWDWCDNICQIESTWCDSKKIDSCISNNCDNLWWSDYDICKEKCNKDCMYVNSSDVNICIHKIVSGWNLTPEDFDLYINQKQFTDKICTYWPNNIAMTKCSGENWEKVRIYMYGITVNNIYNSFATPVDLNLAWPEIEIILNNLSISYTSVSNQWIITWIESWNVINSRNIWASECLINAPDPILINHTPYTYNEYCEWTNKKYVTIKDWKWPVICKNISKESYIPWEVLVWEKPNSSYNYYFSWDCWERWNITNYSALSTSLNCYITNILKCWDWYLDMSNSETCDDGNVVNWDGCNSSCKTENKCNANVGNSCSIGTGACASNGKISCDGICNSVFIVPWVEVCNSIDDNCNGQIDEWLNCGWQTNGWWSIYTNIPLSEPEVVAKEFLQNTTQIVLERIYGSAPKDLKLYILPESWVDQIDL